MYKLSNYIIALGLCIALIPGAIYAVEQAEAVVFAQLASGDDSQIEAVVIELAQAGDPVYYDLMNSLFSGEVYQWSEREEYSGLVAIGDEETDELGDSIVALYSMFPRREALLGGDGSQVKVSVYDLMEVETGRKIRALIQPYLLRAELFSVDEKMRRIAAENIGNRGNLTDLPILQRAIMAEENTDVQRLLRVSVAKLELRDSDRAIRIRAVGRLAELRSPLAVPVLEVLLKKDAAGEFVESDADLRGRAEIALRSLEQFGFFMQIVQTLFIGLSLGSVLVLISLGLAIIYGQMGVINMAHGEFMMIGAYTTFVVQDICATLLPPAYGDLFFAIALPFSFLVAGGCGLVMEALIIRRLYSRPLESLLATWGVSLILVQGARSIFGDLTSVRLPELLSGGYEIAPQVMLPYNRMFIMGLATVIVLSLLAVFFRTRFGLRLRATTQNRDMSACVGIPVRRVDAMAFMMGTGIAGIAGWAMTLIGNVVPNMGQTYIVDAFLVVVTGGVGKLLGTISAGLSLGIFNKLLEPVFEAVYGKVILLGLIILFLQSRPTGLFPAKGRNEDL
ncbi:MAG: urea transport system permease protein [Candidatus Latescibacterota bacterium]